MTVRVGECISRMSVHQHALGRMSNSPKNTKIRERQRRRVQSVTHCVHQNRHSHHFKQKVFSFRHQMHSVFFWWSLDQIINKSSFAEHTHSIQRAAQIIRVSSVHACFVCVHMCVCVPVPVWNCAGQYFQAGLWLPRKCIIRSRNSCA